MSIINSIINLGILILIVSALIALFTYISWKYLRSDISFDEMLAEKKKLREGIFGPPKKKPIKKTVKKKERSDRSPHVKIAKEESEKDDSDDAISSPEEEVEIQLVKTVKNPPPAKKATVKPKTGILINKNEPVLVNKVQQDVPEVNHFEKSHPKDVIEIHREAIEAKEKEKEKEKVVRKPKKVDEVQIVKKKKSDNLAIAPPASITVPVNSQSEEETEIASLIRSLGKAELTRNQIQILIDFLLNKQQDTVAKEPTEWSEGKTDVLQKLKKQLSEKEEQLRNEQASLLALTAKLKELRNEYNTEKSQFNATLKAHIEEIHAKNLEIRNLSQTHVAEKQSLSLQFQQIQQKYLKIQQMKDENLKTIQQLTESNNCLQQQIMFSHQHEESFKSLLAQKDSEICIVKQELQGIKDVEKLYNGQKCDLERLEENTKIEIKNLQNCLNESEIKFSDIQEQNRTLLEEKKNLQEQIESYKEKNNDIRIKNWKLVNALQAHSNSNNTSNNNGVLFQDHQNLIKEKDAQLSEYQKQINSLKSEVDELKKKNVVVVQESASVDKFIQNEQQKLVKNSDTNGHDCHSKDKEIEVMLQNAQLQELLKQTEAMLKNLENKVQEQESYWKNIVKYKDIEISELKNLAEQS